jgi:hypothetical protein
MRKFLLVFTVVAVALALAAPATAAMKLTTKGRMDVTGIWIKNNHLQLEDSAGEKINDDNNAYYLMEMQIDPTLHINDKLRLHARLRMVETNWTSQAGGEFDVNDQGQGNNTTYRSATNFWWERLYLSFPLGWGSLRVGRMSGGGWAFPFQDNVNNRDRVLHMGKIGNITTVLLPIEKLREEDGGAYSSNHPTGTGWGKNVQQPLTNTPAANDSFDQSSSDWDAYAAGIIWPVAKWFTWRPLVYYVDFQPGLGGATPNGATDILFLNGLTFKFWQLKLDAEVNWRNRSQDQFGVDSAGRLQDKDETQFTWWGDLSWSSGPFEAAIGGFYLQGTKSRDSWKNVSHNGTDGEFQPYLLLFSEDMGLLWDTAGVPNGSAGLSGYQSFYFRGSYKLSDTMKVGAVFGWLNAAETISSGTSGVAASGTKTNGAAADDDLGWEFDVSFDWKFMPNIKYVFEAAYYSPGDYYKDITLNLGTATAPNLVDFVDQETSTWGIRHMLVINW